MKERTFALIILGIVTLWALSGSTLYYLPERGTFGDMFGAINSLFSGLAFAAIIYTIALQRDELTLQREELQLARKEMAGQKEALEAQSEHMRIQSFEGTFFQMLKLHNDLINSIDITSGENVFVGRDSFVRAWRRFGSTFHPPSYESPETRLEQIKKSYANFWDSYEGEFSHYFRSLYNIIKYIDKAQNVDQSFYANIVRAQTSNKELVVIFYNCLCEEGKKFKPLIEKYSLLKHLNLTEIGLNTDTQFYEKSAFGNYL